jgi:hypothetical protein
MIKILKHMPGAGVVILNLNAMKEQFEAILTGSDSSIDGIVTSLDMDGFTKAYEFQSIDGSLHLVIAMDNRGKWERISGTEPYFSGWVDELVEQIAISKH